MSTPWRQLRQAARPAADERLLASCPACRCSAPRRSAAACVVALELPVELQVKGWNGGGTLLSTGLLSRNSSASSSPGPFLQTRKITQAS